MLDRRNSYPPACELDGAGAVQDLRPPAAGVSVGARKTALCEDRSGTPRPRATTPCPIDRIRSRLPGTLEAHPPWPLLGPEDRGRAGRATRDRGRGRRPAGSRPSAGPGSIPTPFRMPTAVASSSRNASLRSRLAAWTASRNAAQLRPGLDQGQILHGRGQRRENVLGAGMADDALPVDASGAHQDLKLLGCGAAPQPLSEDASNQIEGIHAARDHFTRSATKRARRFEIALDSADVLAPTRPSVRSLRAPEPLRRFLSILVDFRRRDVAGMDRCHRRRLNLRRKTDLSINDLDHRPIFFRRGTPFRYCRPSCPRNRLSEFGASCWSAGDVSALRAHSTKSRDKA